MIIIKDVPGLTLADIITTVEGLGDPNTQAQTGYGGVVVDERTALEFLVAYFGAQGDVLDEDDDEDEDEPEAEATSGDEDAAEVEAEPPHRPPAAKTVRRPGTPRKKVGES
jgi:hypothetical protein